MTFAFMITNAAGGTPSLGTRIIATDPGTLSAFSNPNFTILPATSGIKATDPSGLYATDNPVFTILTGPTPIGDAGITATDPGALFVTDTVNFVVNTQPPPDPSGSHPMSQNVNGGFVSNSVDRMFDPASVMYLFAMTTQFSAVQPKGMWDGGRATQSAKWTALHQRNPYALFVQHDNPIRVNRCYQSASSEVSQWRYEYVVNNRRTALLYRAQTDDDEVPFIEAGSSQTGNQQTAVALRCADPGLQDHWSGIALDLLAATNLMSRNMIGDDLSDFMGYFNDGSPAVHPKYNRSLTVTKNKGNVVNATVSGSGYLGKGRNIIELDTRYNPTTSGPLPEDASFGALTSTDYIGIRPANNNLPGWAAFVIIGYKTVGSSNSQVYIRTFPSSALTTQLYTVKAGDAFNINDSTTGTNFVDQDASGTGENERDEGNKIWTAGYVAMYNQLNTKMLAATGHGTGRGHNAGGSIALKDNGGLPHPHGGFRTMDYMNAENGDSAGRFAPDASSPTQAYQIDNVNLEQLMGGLYFMESYIRPNPGGWNEGKPRGVLFDISVWSGGYNWSFTNDPLNPGLMATYLRFYRAVMFTVPNTGMGYTIEIGAPLLIEESWLDVDLGWVQPAPLGSYDPEGGSLGSAGFPNGSWVWASGGTGDFVTGNKRIYGRRIGTRHYMFINMGQPPAGRTHYHPSHLANPNTVRNPEDIITPSDFSSIYANGHLVSGETLKKIDPNTYVNETMTALMKSNPLSAADWSASRFKWGPRQQHPYDADNNPVAGNTRNMADTELIARDNAFNDGAAIDQNANFELGNLEAAIFEIVPGATALTINATNNRYFDYKGKTIWLGGHQHMRPVVAQASQIDIPAIMDVPGDIDVYISMLVARGINYIRHLSWFGSSQIGGLGNVAVPLPFARSGTAGANDGGNKFDLTQYDSDHDARVLSFITKCFENDIIVSVEFWDAYGVASNRLQGNCFTAANNINGVNADVDGDGQGYDGMYVSPTAAMETIMTDYEKHVVDQLNHLPNVFYESANELGDIAFHTTFVSRMKAYIATKPNTQLVMVSHGGRVDDGVGSWGTFTHFDKADVVGTGADIVTPGSSPSGLTDWEPTALDFRNNPPVHTEFNMPIIADLDHIQFGLHDHQHLWKCFTRGYHYNIYEDGPDFDEPTGWEAYMNQATDDVVRRNFLVIQAIIARLTDLANMIPSTTVSTSNYALFWAGQEYIVWSEADANFTVNQLVNGATYDHRWYDTDTFSLESTGTTVVTGTSHVFNPAGVNRVLFLKRQ